MKKIFQSIIITLFIMAIASVSYADKVSLASHTQTLYNADSNMEANNANDVLQTDDGYIWIASYNGLIRYDGDTFTRYNKDTSKEFDASSAICLHKDKEGRLWIGTNQDGLFCLEGGIFRKIPNLSDSAFNFIRSFAADSKGNLFVASSGGVGLLTKEGIKRIPLGKQIDDEFVLGLVCDRKDNIWGVSRSGEVFVYKEGHLKHLFGQKEMLGHSAVSLLVRSDGTIALGMADGGIAVAVMKNGKYNFKYYPSSPVVGINGLYEDTQKRLWLCGDNGLGYYKKNYEFTVLEGSLINNSIEKIYEDYEGSFWITSSREGLLYIAKNKFMNVNFAVSLPRGVVNATQEYGGLLYVGTDNGLYAIDKKWQIVKNQITKKLEGSRIRNLMVDSKDGLWVSTFNAQGLAHLSPDGEIKFYSKAEGLPNENVRMSLEQRNGDVAVATNNGVGIIRDGKIIKRYTQKDGLHNSTILNMCEDDEGILYLGSDGGGIYSVKDNVLKNYNKGKELRYGVIMRMLYDSENRGIWISTASRLDFCSDSGIHTVHIKPGMAGAGIYDLKKAPNGDLMLLADTGIYIADPRDLLAGKTLAFTSYSRKDGLRSSVTANSWNYMDKSGQLYLCCANGIYAINVSNVFINKQNPKIAIRNAEIDGIKYENPTKLSLSSEVKRLTLDLSVLSFINNEYNEVEYTLEGFDKEKTVKLMKDFERVTYTNLKGGNYRFIFSAKNSDGVDSVQPISLIIEKEKKLMEQPLFILLLIVCGITTVFILTRFYYLEKEKKLLARQQELREITTQAITAIANTIDAKDAYTKGHSSRVAGYSVLIAKKMGYDSNKIDNLYYTALLHDIGKIGIPDHILNKRDKLTDEEYEIIKQHPAIGGNILKTITVIPEIKEGAAYHHERFDGTGYNTGLKGNEIPLTARIIGVADALDAMASTRSYRKQCMKEYVISEIKKYSGTQFDPQIAQILVDLIKTNEIKI